MIQVGKRRGMLVVLALLLLHPPPPQPLTPLMACFLPWMRRRKFLESFGVLHMCILSCRTRDA